MTTHLLFVRHSAALGIDSYNTFCKLLKLLDAPAMLQEYPGGCAFYGPPLHFEHLHEAIADMHIRVTAPNQKRVRITLLNGTVIREWPIDEYDGIF